MIGDRRRACFRGQAQITPFDVIFDVMAKGLPVILSGDELASLLDSKVTGQEVVMVTANELRLNDLGELW